MYVCMCSYAKAAAEEGGYGAAVFSNLIGLEMGSLGLGGLPSPASLLADASAAASGAAQRYRGAPAK